MAPIAAAAYVMIGSVAVIAVMMGAFAGALAWALKGRVRGSLFWCGLVAVGVSLAAEPVLSSVSRKAALVIGTPLLMLTLLTSWLMACCLETRARWRRPWAALAAFGGALLLGFLWGLQFRLGIWVPVWTAFAADLGLIVYLIVSRFRTRRPPPMTVEID